jgi:hypothetical protein
MTFPVLYFGSKTIFLNVIFAVIIVLFQVCYTSCTGVKAVNWPVALFSNSGTFCVPGMTHPGFSIRGWEYPGQSGTAGKPSREACPSRCVRPHSWLLRKSALRFPGSALCLVQERQLVLFAGSCRTLFLTLLLCWARQKLPYPAFSLNVIVHMLTFQYALNLCSGHTATSTATGSEYLS